MLIAFDGTWNRPIDKGADASGYRPEFGASLDHLRDTQDSNVVRFQRLYGDDRSLYIPGVGTRYGLAGKGLGGFSGAGARSRIRQAYRAVCARWLDGDHHIDVIGFSRGAALAVHFANVLDTVGIQDPEARTRAPRWTREFGFSRIPTQRLGDDRKPKISFLGLWDAVSAFGVPVGSMRDRLTLLDVYTIPPNVDVFAHAMALDEYRRSFRLLRPRAFHTDPYEVWFRGVHNNIGGGENDRGLSDIALAWMMHTALVAWKRQGKHVPREFEEALDLADLTIDSEVDWMHRAGKVALAPNPHGEIARPKKFPGVSIGWGRRPLVPDWGGKIFVHHTAPMRSPSNLTDHVVGNRTIWQRLPLNAVLVYDPPNMRPPTKAERAQSNALTIFRLIPTRPSEEFRFGDWYGYRADDWCALGTVEQRWNGKLPDSIVHRETFLRAVQEWLMLDRPVTLKAPPDLVGYTADPGDQPPILSEQDGRDAMLTSLLLARTLLERHPALEQATQS